jgi:nucleotide-binding universal stress UspA family protein
VTEEAAGLLVVGGPAAEAPYGPHRFRPVTSSAVHHAPCAVLVVPRVPTGTLVA